MPENNSQTPNKTLTALQTAYQQAFVAEDHARVVFNAALKALRKAESEKSKAAAAIADHYQTPLPLEGEALEQYQRET
jgi:hypothetical protein